MSPVTRRFGQPALVALALALAVAVIAAGSARALPSTTLVINEIDYDQPSTDTAEFLELKNVSTGTIDLDPYSVVLVNGNGGGAAIYRTIDLPAVNLAAGDYYVICANAANTPNCDQDVAPDTDWAQNGAPDAIGLRDGTTLVDAVSYEGNTGAPYTEGSGSRRRGHRRGRRGRLALRRRHGPERRGLPVAGHHAGRRQHVPAAADPLRRVR